MTFTIRPFYTSTWFYLGTCFGFNQFTTNEKLVLGSITVLT